MGFPASHGVPQPREGWQPSDGIGGSFAVESAAAFAWNRWQAYYGISGSFRVERVAALPWNQWQDSPGIGGSFAVEYATCFLKMVSLHYRAKNAFFNNGCTRTTFSSMSILFVHNLLIYSINIVL